MTPEEFQQTVTADPHLLGPIQRAARAGRPAQFGLVTEAAVVTLMFPIVNYVLIHIGLPWLYELKRYSELQRQKLHRWIDEKHRELGLDPDAAEAAGEALCRELEETTAAEARAAWEDMARLVKNGS